MTKAVYVVHCIDTEGPLHESIDATFERLKDIFGLSLPARVETLRALQQGELELGGIEDAVRKVVDPHLLSYNDTWDKVDAMLAIALSSAFRRRTLDSAGSGWIYNWFCVDHVNYEVNPRRRDIGYHNVFDHYRRALRETDSSVDGIHFHYHPHPFRPEAHRCATAWLEPSGSLQQVLSRRVIERNWFPAASRPGFHVIRPDSHWFLEQYIPFDFSSQASVPTDADKKQSGLLGGRFGDWRRAPLSWEPYHPSHDDYQAPGGCRRWIARCLNVGTRYRLLQEGDVRLAFSEARAGKPVVLAFTNHDFRDLRPDVGTVGPLLARVAADFPDIPFYYSEAVQAMRQALSLPAQAPCELEFEIQRVSPKTHILEVRSEVPTFGPQPWLALKTRAGTFHHDNYDIEVPYHRWQYVFDAETFPLEDLRAVGVAANNATGATTVVNWDGDSRQVTRCVWNEGRPATLV